MRFTANVSLLHPAVVDAEMLWLGIGSEQAAWLASSFGIRLIKHVAIQRSLSIASYPS